jgi:hypothetical protein
MTVLGHDRGFLYMPFVYAIQHSDARFEKNRFKKNCVSEKFRRQENSSWKEILTTGCFGDVFSRGKAPEPQCMPRRERCANAMVRQQTHCIGALFS